MSLWAFLEDEPEVAAPESPCGEKPADESYFSIYCGSKISSTKIITLIDRKQARRESSVL